MNVTLPEFIVFGVGKVNEVGVLSKKYGKKAMVVTGGNSTKKSGLLQKVCTLLGETGVEHVVFDKVMANPTNKIVAEGADVAKLNSCDFVVAVGGGSSLDCAKAIAFSVLNQGEIYDYIEQKKSGESALPLVTIPTTCGTGSEGNCFAVINNTETFDKKALRKDACLPALSIVDPSLMLTMPKSVAGSVMFDAFCHNLEAYISKVADKNAEEACLHGLKLLCDNMVKAYRDYSDIEAWSAVTLGSTLGGINIGVSGVTAAHGMEHPASGLKDITHGRGLAALAPFIYEKSIEGDTEKFAKVAVIMRGKTEKDFVPLLKRLIKNLDIETNLENEGIEKTDLATLIADCIESAQGYFMKHPVHFTDEEVKIIYNSAFSN